MKDVEGKKRLVSLLGGCFEVYPAYSRDAEQAATIRRAFQMVLADFTIQQIEAAFRYHLKYSKDFPVPADIAQVVLRGNKPPFERSVYISITKKQGEDRTPDEWQYVREYEKFILTGRY